MDDKAQYCTPELLVRDPEDQESSVWLGPELDAPA
jgi:hypothetical protein